MRGQKFTTVANRCDGAHHCQGCHLEAILAYGSIVSITQSPRITVKDSKFPSGARNITRFLVRPVDAGLFVQTKELGVFFEFQDAYTLLPFKSPAYDIEINVGGNLLS